ncbi:LysE family translocator [Brevibacterium samyangense]|uniref:LysE family translocator n=1 Tax=Brevibacterium samyangense TaxID=366888 RepID=A0ABN2TB56_9MICO
MTGAEYWAFFGASVVLAVTPGPDTFLTLRFGAKGWKPGFLYACAVATGILVWAVLSLTVLGALLDRYPWLLEVLTYAGAAYLLYLGITSVLGGRKQLKALAPARREVVATGKGEGVLVGAGTTAVTGVAGGATVGLETAPLSTGTESAPSTGDTVAVGDTIATRDTNGTDTAPPDRTKRSKLDGNPYVVGVFSGLTNPKTGLFFLALLPPFLPASPSGVDYVLLVLTMMVTIWLYSLLLVAAASRVGRWLQTGRGPAFVDLVSGGILVVLAVLIVLTH